MSAVQRSDNTRHHSSRRTLGRIENFYERNEARKCIGEAEES
jgi:hypothetical protein